MEYSDIIIAAIGIGISVITFFLKKESRRVDRMEEKMLSIQQNLTRNNCRDDERWRWLDKNMDDRRADIRKLYDFVRQVEHKACENAYKK